MNAIHLYTGYKAELFLLRPGDVYRETAFGRRRLVDLGPPLGEVYVHAPEDLILNKLHETWAERLSLINLWREVQDQAQSRP